MTITFDILITLVLYVCITALILAILADFLFYNQEEKVKKSQHSIVATGTMFLFFILYYAVITSRSGQLDFQDEFIGQVLAVIGTIMVAAGTLINILGRLQLKENWANHIKIYDSHELIRTGVYGIVRHPLYASLMLMFLGGVLVYKNYLGLLLTVLVFIPFMAYRAVQEELMLLKEFPEYQEYKNSTGMFFPKI